MGIFLKQYSKNLDWIIWEVEESVDDLQAILCCDLVLKQVASIKTEKRKTEFLCSRILLKELFNQCINVDYREFGSPYIKKSEWNISITHSGKYVAVARSKYPLGIDIEQISEKLNRTKYKYSSKQELNYLDDTQELYHLTLYWSAKESVYKLIANEALIFDEEMNIEKFIPQDKGKFTLVLKSPKSKEQLKVFYQKLKDYVFTYSYLSPIDGKIY